MGHMLPHAFTAWGSLILPLETAVTFVLSLLYLAAPLPQVPKSNKTAKQSTRNAEIKRRYHAGETVPDLAKEYGVSEARVYQILKGRRK